MFCISDNGIVTVNRGDYFELPISLNIGSSLDHDTYMLKDIDSVYVGVMEPNQPFENAIVRKKFISADQDDKGVITAQFWPEDTLCLLPGKYYYQVKLETTLIDSKTTVSRKSVKTIVDKTLFYIQE